MQSKGSWRGEKNTHTLKGGTNKSLNIRVYFLDLTFGINSNYGTVYNIIHRIYYGHGKKYSNTETKNSN